MVRAAAKAGKPLRRDFGELENIQFSQRGTLKFSHNSWLFSERNLKESLIASRPDFTLFSYDQKPDKNENKYFILHPISGYENFIRGLPYFAICIFAKNGPRTEAAVIYDPLEDYLFWAEGGIGACINDQKLRVTQRGQDVEHAIALSLTGQETLDKELSQKLLHKVYDYQQSRKNCTMLLKQCPELDLAYTAKAHLDVSVFANPNFYLSKMCKLFMKETNGIARTIQHNEEQNTMVCGNLAAVSTFEDFLSA